MALHVRGGPAADAGDVGDGGGDEESAEEFEARVYEGILSVMRASSERARSALASCVLLGTPYDGAPDVVRQTIRQIIEAAEL
jgi:hypothetical protein